jgi:hypothetical protein
MTYQTNRPRRERKADRLLSPDATRAQIECDYAIAPMDRLALEMDRKWGIDRLPELVTPEMATRYGQAMAHMNECIRLSDPAKCVAAANNCIRGLHAMDAEATKLGRKPASGAYTEYDLDGWKIGILHDDAEWRTAEADRPDLQFFTLREAAIALKTKIDTPPIAAVKAAFPGARVVEHRTPLNTLLNDSIPFQRTDA